MDSTQNRKKICSIGGSLESEWRSKISKLTYGIQNAVYPMKVRSLWFFVASTVGLHWSGYSVPLNLVNRCSLLLPNVTTGWQLVSCTISGLTFWLFTSYALRYTLTLLLTYKGWMYESRGKGSSISLATKVWATIMKGLASLNKPKLYSYQGIIPRLPVPSIQHTTQKYLRSMRPLLDDEKYKHIENLVNEFRTTIANKLQRYLTIKSWWSRNYVTDWWEEYIYLHSRSPLMIGSNVYGLDVVYMFITKVQAARAANIIHTMFLFRSLLEKQEVSTVMIQGIIPICSRQYKKIFNTVRIPGTCVDQIVHYDDSNHIVVLHKGCYYKVIICHEGRLLKPCQIQTQMEAILKSNYTPSIGEERVASLTAGNRTTWANARATIFSKGVNKEALDTIERAVFFVSLDNEPYEFDINEPEKLNKFGATILHGKGCDRWFDKSINFCLGSNGRIGFNADHSWADAPIMSHMWEFLLAYKTSDIGYDENGNTIGTIEYDPPLPQRIKWDLDNNVALTAINNAYNAAQELIQTMDLNILVHEEYGKSFIKTCQVSPDAYIQMALQLAYFREVGHFALTYEATLTRLFLEGRTETVRSCTIESTAWIKCMMDETSTVEDRVYLLQKACQQHQIGFQDAMCGKGIDRHLFCLYMVSKHLEVTSPFLEEAVMNAKWQLSTSQQPHSQQNDLEHNKCPTSISAGGGFGSIVEDGYGVAYFLPVDHLLFFHVISKKTCDKTDSKRFAGEIKRALADIRNLFEEYHRLRKSKKDS